MNKLSFEDSTVEILGRNLKSKKFPCLPTDIKGSTMFMHDRNIFVCGGAINEKKCLQMTHGSWKEHSTLNERRAWHSTLTTQTATFAFGGIYSEFTYEYLSKDSTTWLVGKTKIPSGFRLGCAITVKSNEEVWLIGGYRTEKRILSFNVKNHIFQVLPLQLNVERSSFASSFIPNTNKVMISGGHKSIRNLDSTEILDLDDISVKMASPMNFRRSGHGMGVITINGEDRLVTFGGCERYVNHDSIEVYNYQTKRWITSDIKLKEAKSDFSFLSLKLSDVISNL